MLPGGPYDLNTDKGEVGGSSPPRPTIQIIKHAAILTFPLFGDLTQKSGALGSYCRGGPGPSFNDLPRSNRCRLCPATLLYLLS